MSDHHNSNPPIYRCPQCGDEHQSRCIGDEYCEKCIELMLPKELTLEEAKNLKHGDIIHQTSFFNSDATCRRWKVNGKVKTWKTDPSRIEIPLKHGMYVYGTLTHYNIDSFHLPENCQNPKKA